MKLLLATGIFPPEPGGPATYTREMARSLMSRGHQVVVVTYGDASRVDIVDGFVVHHLSRRGGWVVRYARYAWKVFCLARHVDLVYAQGPVSEGLPTTIGSRLAGRPLVMKIVGDYAWEMAMQLDSATPLLDNFLKRRHAGRVGWYEKIERWTAKKARRVIVPSRYLASVVERWGVSRKRVDVILNATQPLVTTTSRKDDRAHFGVSDQVVFFYAGRAVPWKNIDDLISWWKMLPETHMIVIAGSGPELEGWKKLAHDEGVAARVRFVGSLDRDQLAHWYNAVDAFVLPSGYEGYPNVIAEAASVGVPCFVSDQGGNPETHETFGNLVTVLPYKDQTAWVEALKAVGVRSLMSRTVPTWSHEEMIETTEAVLQETLGERLDGKLQVIMLSYDRDLLDVTSDVFKRVSALVHHVARERRGKADIHIHALILSGGLSDAMVTSSDGGLTVQSFRGHSLSRLWNIFCRGVSLIRLLPGRAIVTAQDPFVAGLIGYVISRWTRTPLEIQEHGDFFSGAWVHEAWSHRVWSWVGCFILRRAEGVRVVSERVKQQVIRLGAATERVTTIPVAQSLEAFLQRPLSDSSVVRHIVAPCRFVSQKGLDTLLAAASLLKRRGFDVAVHLIGQGPLQGWLEQEISSRCLKEVVHLEPWKDVQALWDGADLFVLTSRYEGWGRTIVEAMAAGIPIVTTDVGCVGSFFRPQIDGRVVQPDDPEALVMAIIEQIQEMDRRTAMQISARERALMFPTAIELQAKQRVAWYQTLRQGFATNPRWELWVGIFLLFVIVSRMASVILFHNSLQHPEVGFLTLVQNWLHGYGYSFVPELGCASAYRSPGFLFFLTALYTFFSPNNTWAQAIIQNLFVIGVLWLVYVVGQRLVGKRAALVAGFLMAIYPYTFYHYTQYYHTFLSSFFLLLLLWCILRLDETRRLGWAVVSGLVMACLAYVQGTILPVAPLIVAWLAYRWWPDIKYTIKAACIMAVFCAALIAPWTYRNWTVFHHFIPLTTDTGHALFKANNEIIYELTKRGYPQEIVDVEISSSTNPNVKQYRLSPDIEAEFRRDGVYRESIYWTEWHPIEPGRLEHCPLLGQLNEYDFNQYWTNKAKDWIKQHWWTEGWKLQLLKAKTFWQPSLFPSVKTGAPWSFADSPLQVSLARWSMTVASVLVIFGGWIGILWMIARRDKKVWLPLAILVIYTFLHTFFAGYTKYRIPLDNLMAMYAGWFLVKMIDGIRGISSSSVIPTEAELIKNKIVADVEGSLSESDSSTPLRSARNDKIT